jgi:phosphoribosylformylglycinamidine cyclo-ligase
LIKSFSYQDAGVFDNQEIGLSRLLKWISKTNEFRDDVGKAVLEAKYFANVVKINDRQGIAVATDGVGTKIILAELMKKYDTVGIDCIAMNANDVLCVGATPISMVDYIAVEKAIPEMLEDLAKGFCEGARQAQITIAGGEVAQLKDMIRGISEGSGFDLVGTCIGLVELEKIIIGQDLEEDDVIVGLESSGIHSNGLSLARKVLLDEASLSLDQTISPTQDTLGEELLKPTKIYVKEITEMFSRGLLIKALAHITGDGFLNLLRTERKVGYVIDSLPPVPPIFALIQEKGNVSDEEMFRVFNMGIGFCVVVSPSDAQEVIAISEEHGTNAYTLGRVVEKPEGSVHIVPKNLIGQGKSFREKT